MTLSTVARTLLILRNGLVESKTGPLGQIMVWFLLVNISWVDNEGTQTLKLIEDLNLCN